LERLGADVLRRLALPRDYLGFTMVAINNAFWQPLLEAVPFHRRLFLLPHCLSDRAACAGTYDSVGLHCAGCGRCEINALKNEAERLGYSVIVAEGTSSVLMKVLEDDADAIFGVACLDSLEKSFQRIIDLGVPHIAVPLLKDGCTNTEAELDQIRAVLAAKAETGPESPGSAAAVAPPSYIPLLRETAKMFQPPQFGELLQPYLESPDAAVAIQGSESTDGLAADPPSTEAIALQWLREGGKRLRPFVTLAAYAVAKDGFASLSKTNQPSGLPIAIRRLALAIEALHKASLVHDDIEDNDEYRYGRPTLHRVHGIDQTINVGVF
jgi:geranylgeranyl diphosphate synthase type II